ncbi:MAG: hypothetical protein R3F59_11175 [Myxococcota bacterium]
MLAFAALFALAAPQPPLVEIDHPRYADALGEPLDWDEVRDLARGTGALGQVRRRRAGRWVLRGLFAGATATAAWGTFELARLDEGRNWPALPLGLQTASLGLCEVLLWTNTPSAILEDRTIIVGGANRALGWRR